MRLVSGNCSLPSKYEGCFSGSHQSRIALENLAAAWLDLIGRKQFRIRCRTRCWGTCFQRAHMTVSGFQKEVRTPLASTSISSRKGQHRDAGWQVPDAGAGVIRCGGSQIQSLTMLCLAFLKGNVKRTFCKDYAEKRYYEKNK